MQKFRKYVLWVESNKKSPGELGRAQESQESPGEPLQVAVSTAPYVNAIISEICPLGKKTVWRTALALQKASMGMGTFYIWHPLQAAVRTVPHV